MNCSEIQPNLMDYNLGRLTRSESDAVRAHLAVCAECSAVLEEEKVFDLRLGEIGVAAPVNDVWALVRARTHPRRGILRLMHRRAVQLVATVAATAAVTLTVISMHPGQAPKSMVDKNSVHAVAAIMTAQPARSGASGVSLDDPLGPNSDALAATLDEGM